MEATVKIEMTNEQVYDELKRISQEAAKNFIGKSEKLNSKGRQYFVFPVLDEAGFNTWQKIYDEAVLISNKKSNQSKIIRENIATAYFQVIDKTKELNKSIFIKEDEKTKKPQ